MTVLLHKTKATCKNDGSLLFQQRLTFAVCQEDTTPEPLICSWMIQKDHTCVFARFNPLTSNHLLYTCNSRKSTIVFEMCRLNVLLYLPGSYWFQFMSVWYGVSLQTCFWYIHFSEHPAWFLMQEATQPTPSFSLCVLLLIICCLVLNFWQ